MTHKNSEYNTLLVTNFDPLEVEVFGNVVIKKLKLDNAINVYCQSCGKDITSEGGIISTASRSVYCYTNGNGKPCLDKEIRSMIKGEIPKMALGFHYLSADGMQEKIMQKKLTKFGPLERKLDDKKILDVKNENFTRS